MTTTWSFWRACSNIASSSARPAKRFSPITGSSARAGSRAAAARGRCDRQHLVGGAVGRVFLPAHRAERPLQHAADAHRIGPEVKINRALMQRALGLGRAIALAQIVEPGRAMIALGP